MSGKLVDSLKSTVKISQTLGISNLSVDFYIYMKKKKIINFHPLRSPPQTKFYLGL